MLRYICLLCFIIVINIDLGFCYNYISGNHRRAERQRRARVGRQAGLEEAPLQQLDVANFLSADESEGYSTLNSEDLYGDRKSYRAEAWRRRRQNAPDPAYFTEASDGLSSYQRQQLARRNLVRRGKKCSLKKVFPFFSREEPKDKKGKKFCFCKKEKEVSSSTTESVSNLHKDQHTQKTIDDPHMEKRYAEEICPRCKMKYLKLKELFQPKMIHNSRQYFANNPEKELDTSSKQHTNANVIKRRNMDIFSKLRRKKRRVLQKDPGT